MTLETADPRALAAFYRAAFDWEEISRDEDRVWLGCGGRSRIGLWSPGRKEFGDEGGRHVHFAVSISSGGLDRLAERLRRKGIEFTGPIEHEGGDRSLYLEDPERNVVEAWDFFEHGSGARDGIEALD